MSHVEIGNARDDEQRARMERHARLGRCHFCQEGFHEHKSPVIYGDTWCFVTGNDMPYEGTKYHYLIVIRRHITAVGDMDASELAAFGKAIKFLVEKLGVDGYSIFVRSGNMKITGATLDHIHFHFVVGEEKKDAGHEMVFAPVGYKTTPVTK